MAWGNRGKGLVAGDVEVRRHCDDDCSSESKLNIASRQVRLRKPGPLGFIGFRANPFWTLDSASILRADAGGWVARLGSSRLMTNKGDMSVMDSREETLWGGLTTFIAWVSNNVVALIITTTMAQAQDTFAASAAHAESSLLVKYETDRLEMQKQYENVIGTEPPTRGRGSVVQHLTFSE